MMVIFEPLEQFLTYLPFDQVLVQLGDILDRGEDEIAILSLLRSLQIQAKEHGGAVFQVGLLEPIHFFLSDLEAKLS